MQADIADIIRRLQERQFVNEDSLKLGIVVRILQALHWDVYDAQVVMPEFGINGGRVDYALCNQRSKPQIFIEVKQEATFAAGEDQLLMRYAFQLGVPIAILTDGRRWSFYLPGGSGTFQERRFYHLDLLERELDEIESRLQRYLSFEAVKSGSAFDAARSDYDDAVRARAVEEALPRAWREMLRESDPNLGQALSEKVSSLAGYQPKDAEITTFLRSQVPHDPTRNNNGSVSSKKRVEAKSEQPKSLPKLGIHEPPLAPVTSTSLVDDKSSWYSVNGVERSRSKVAVDITAAAFRGLASAIPELLELFEKEEDHKRQGRKNQKRRWLAQRKEDLYANPKFFPNSVEVAPGWWLGTHYSNRDKSEMLTIAKRIAAQHGVTMEFELA